ncbi:hypothetical protein BBK36DRAFT_1083594, partial [Trichoderma citrinoviride]
VPWPGDTYKIIEESTGASLAVHYASLRLLDFGNAWEPNLSWLCVETNGYFGFFHPRSNLYLSAHGTGINLSKTFGPDQYFIPRKHPKGGYQLLSPEGPNTLKQLAVLLPNQTQIVRRQHAGTIWRFV